MNGFGQPASSGSKYALAGYMKYVVSGVRYVVDRIKGVYKRKDNRWEARYKKGIDENGRAIYGAVYGDSQDEVVRKRAEITGCAAEQNRPDRHLNLLILGAGSHGRNVKEVAESLRIFHKISFLDDRLTGDDILGKCSEAMKFATEYPCACIAIGDNRKRKKWAQFLKERDFILPCIIAPTANISPKAVIGEGVVALPHCTVGEAVIGDFCILASNSLVSIDSEVGRFCHIDEGGICPKKSRVAECVWIKSGEVYGK